MKANDDALARLDDYVLGALPDEEVDAYEEDLFARALRDEAPELAFREGLRRTLRALSDGGTLQVWLTAKDVAKLVASGRKILQYELDPARPVAPDLSGDFDVLVTRVPFSVADDVEHLDVEILTPDGQLIKTMPDVTFDRADGALFICCERELAIASASVATVTRLWGRSPAGRRLLVELDETRYEESV